jgi:ABC-type polysaccharide/polyol phosphate export permease
MRFFLQYVKEGIDFFYQLYLNRNTLRILTWRNFEKQYIRNFFGFVWALLDPLAFVVILYVVMGARYSDKNPNAVPFVVYLLTGYIAFDFFSSTLVSVTNSIMEHSFLIKKVSFKVAILPLVAICSNLIIHFIVLLICLTIMMFHHIYPNWYWFQTFYYLMALSIFLVSVGWLTSSIYLFFPDIRNIISIITRIMFFLTPLFWSMQGILPRDQVLLKLNPLYYIVNGYRDSLLYKIGFWQHPIVTAYFWGLCLFFLIVGVTVFKKLRPHFADVVA